VDQRTAIPRFSSRGIGEPPENQNERQSADCDCCSHRRTILQASARTEWRVMLIGVIPHVNSKPVQSDAVAIPSSQPTMQPTIEPSSTFLQGFAQPSDTCKLLEVQDSHRLKRLASAVQLRPWPPCFQSLNLASNPKPVPFCSKKQVNSARRSLPQLLSRGLRWNLSA